MTDACGQTTSNAEYYFPISTCDDGNHQSSKRERFDESANYRQLVERTLLASTKAANTQL